MNEMNYRQQLSAMAQIAGEYPAGAELSGQLLYGADSSNSIPYCAAVLGESKRGKSSLINTLLGQKLLPESVFPMPAVLVRVEHGNEQKVCVSYHDGRMEEAELQHLSELMTAEGADRIAQIMIFHPSEFGRNQITLLDTPGLNDTPLKNETALEAVSAAQSVIMTISALCPLSITEQEVMMTLKSLPGIRKLLLVVTRLDMFAPEQQEAMVTYIRDQVAARCGFIPTVLAGNAPGLVCELLELLKSDKAQALTDVVAEVAESIRQQMDIWYNDAMAALNTEEAALRKQLDEINTGSDGLQMLNQKMVLMDKHMEERGITADGLQIGSIEESLIQPFIARLSAIRTDTNTDVYIRHAISQGSSDALQAMTQASGKLMDWIRTEMSQVEADFGAQRVSQGLDAESFAAAIRTWQENSFPTLQWTGSILPEQPDLKGVNVIPHIRKVVRDSLTAYGEELNRYIGSWRVVLFRQNAQDVETLKERSEQKQKLDQIVLQKEALRNSHEDNTRKIADICRMSASRG